MSIRQNTPCDYDGICPYRDERISKELFDQIKWERDIAIRQLAELGYRLGEKIRKSDDLIDRQFALEKAENQWWLGELREQEKYLIIRFIEHLPSAPLEKEG